jgi:hypothetical protein
MPALYVNVPPDMHMWIEHQAQAARTTKSHVVEVITREAMRRGWTVEGGTPDTVRTGDEGGAGGPAVSSPMSGPGKDGPHG